MDFVTKLRDLASRIPSIRDQLNTEEATKNALVMPFINALGYNVFDPLEVIPEFIADVGIKKGEKVDYAIKHDGKLAILFECKQAGTDLEVAPASQLYRYFSVTAARIAILTDGIAYRFFSDLDEPNRMDSRPFLEFDMLSFNEKLAEEVKMFSKEEFDLEKILATARDLKYLKGIKRLLQDELAQPTEEFVKVLVGRVYDGRLTQSVREQFTDIAKKAFQEFVNEQVNRRLRAALDRGGYADTPTLPDPDDEPVDDSADEKKAEPSIVTTDEEIEAFYIVKSIVREVVDGKRVFMRDTQSYCGVLLDDNNRKPICRLFFNSTSKKHLGLFDAEKNVERFEIATLDDIYSFAERLRETAKQYD